MSRSRRGTPAISLLLLIPVLASGFLGQGLVAATGADEVTRGSPVPGVTRPSGALALAARPNWQDPESTCDVLLVVETPDEETPVPQSTFLVTGWAVSLGATDDPGIGEVRISVDTPPQDAPDPGLATYGVERLDIAAELENDAYAPAGFLFDWDTTGLTAGSHALYVQARSECGWMGTMLNVIVEESAAASVAGEDSPAADALVAPPVADTPTPTPAPVDPSLSPTATPPPSPTPAPSPTSTIPAPTYLTAAMSPRGDVVTLSWIAPPMTVASYIVLQNQNDGTQQPVTEVPGSQTRVNIGGLESGVGYSFAVQAVDTAGNRGNVSTPVSTAGAPTMTPLPTSTPIPTWTLMPTWTPPPIWTPVPPSMPFPTPVPPTPPPTATPLPPPTAVPTATPRPPTAVPTATPRPPTAVPTATPRPPTPPPPTPPPPTAPRP